MARAEPGILSSVLRQYAIGVVVTYSLPMRVPRIRFPDGVGYCSQCSSAPGVVFFFFFFPKVLSLSLLRGWALGLLPRLDYACL